VSPLRARLAGAFVLAASAGLLAWNVWSLEHQYRFTPYAFVIAFIGVFVAPLLVIAGAPIDPRTGRQARWFRFASGGLAFAGAAMGVLLSVLWWNGLTLLP